MLLLLQGYGVTTPNIITVGFGNRIYAAGRPMIDAQSRNPIYAQDRKQYEADTRPDIRAAQRETIEA
jgi:hypothetical protein